MKIARYYFYSTFYPLLGSLLLVFVFSILDNINYKSEWLSPGAVVAMNIMFTVAYSLVISVVCLPIFLLRFEAIRTSKFLRAVCWFLLPCILVTVMFIYEIGYAEYAEKPSTDFLYMVFLNLPFVVCLIGSYRNYMRSGDQ